MTPASAIDPTLVKWARRALRKRGLGPNDPVTWMIEYQEGRRPDRDPETVIRGMHLDPFDALVEAEMAAGWGAAQRGIGRWMVESLGEEGTTPDHLVVVPHDDPDGGLPLTACL